MKNFVQPGNVVTVTAPYTVTSGSLVFVGSLAGVAVADAASAAPVEIATDGVFTLTHAVTNTAAAVGDIAYFDTTARAISSTATFARAGVFMAAKVTTSTAVTVRLNGTF